MFDTDDNVINRQCVAYKVTTHKTVSIQRNVTYLMSHSLVGSAPLLHLMHDYCGQFRSDIFHVLDFVVF